MLFLLLLTFNPVVSFELFVGSDEGYLYILNGSNTQGFANRTAPIISLENLPNNLLAAGNTLGVIQIYDLIQKNIIATINQTGEITCILAINKTHFASASSLGSIIIWNSMTFDSEIIISNAHSESVDFLKANQNILYSASKDKFLKKWSSSKNFTYLGSVPTSVEFIDDIYLACCCLDSTVKIFDTEFNLLKEMTALYNIYFLKYLNNGYLAFGYSNGLVEIRNLTGFKMDQKIETRHVIQSIELLTENLTAILCKYGHILIWDYFTNKYFLIQQSLNAKSIKKVPLIKDNQNVRNSDLKKYINFYEMDDANLIKFLQLKENTAMCIQNCSGHGICKISLWNLSDFFCNCEPNFYGYGCQFDRRICQISKPCYETGQCLDLYNQTSLIYEYICELFNITNISCPKNSFLNRSLKCECKYLYKGDNCEIESEYLVFIKNVKWYSSILAYLILGFLFFLFLLSDLIELCCRNHNKQKRKKIKVIKLKYYNKNYF